MRLHELFVNKGEVDEGDVVDISTPMPAEFINWLKTKDLPISKFIVLTTAQTLARMR